MKIKLSRHRFGKNEISKFLGVSHVIKTDLFSIFYLDDNQQHYAFICPKKIGNAPNRNKIKRQLKEAFLKCEEKINPKFSLIIMANKKIIHSSFKNIHDMLLLSLKKKSIIDENS